MRTSTKFTALALGAASMAAVTTTLIVTGAEGGISTSPAASTTAAPTSASPTTVAPAKVAPKKVAPKKVDPSTVVTSSAPASETPASTTPASAALMQKGDSSDQVTLAQRYLWRLGHLSVEPTGFYGDMTVSAVKAFQAAAGLPGGGQIDQATWQALEAKAASLPDPQKPEPTKPEPAKKDKSEPAATKTTKTPAANPKGLDSRCLTGEVICISKQTNRLYWVVYGKVQDDWSIRTGRSGLETREGVFTVFQKDEKSWSNLYHVWMPYAMYFSGGQAVHYSSDFAQNGYNEGSHGCVNMRDYDGIAWLFSQVKVGTKVVVYS